MNNQNAHLWLCEVRESNEGESINDLLRRSNHKSRFSYLIGNNSATLNLKFVRSNTIETSVGEYQVMESVPKLLIDAKLVFQIKE